MPSLVFSASLLLILMVLGATALAVRPHQLQQHSEDVVTARNEDVRSQSEAGDEAEMRARMADLILSLMWYGGDLDDSADVGDPPQVEQVLSRGRRDSVVFRPLWVTRERDALDQRRRRQRQRLWALRRTGRSGRALAESSENAVFGESDVDPVGIVDDVVESRDRRQAPRARREAAPLSEAALTGRPLSRTRRQWVFRPLFASQLRAARPRSRRVRREWADVPMFAVKQIEGERLREEHEGERQRQAWWRRGRGDEYSRHNG